MMVVPPPPPHTHTLDVNVIIYIPEWGARGRGAGSTVGLLSSAANRVALGHGHAQRDW
jgi:hypothetical protein